MSYHRPDPILRWVQGLIVLLAFVYLLLLGWLIFQLFIHLLEVSP